MVNGDSFIFYPSFLEDLEKIKDEGIRVKVLLSILKYGCYNTPIDLSDIDPDGFLSVGINSIVRDIDSAKAKREEISKKRSEAGKRGGGQKGNQNARKKGHSEDDLDDDVDESDRPKRANPTNPTKRTFDSKTSLDVDVDVDGDNKEINNFISNAAAEQIRKKEDDKPSLDYNKIAGMWNEICISYPPVQRMTKGRKEKTYQRISEFGLDYESVKALFKKIENSEFLRGKSWATYDWIFDNEDNFAKAIEGQYGKIKPKSFAEVNKNVNALWAKREREAELEWMKMHPNEYWKDVEFDTSQFN